MRRGGDGPSQASEGICSLRWRGRTKVAVLAWYPEMRCARRGVTRMGCAIGSGRAERAGGESSYGDRWHGRIPECAVELLRC